MVKKKKVPSYIVDGVKYLSQEHLNKLESFHKDEEIKKLELEVNVSKSQMLSEKRQKLSADLEVVNKELEINSLKKIILTKEHNMRGLGYRQFLDILDKLNELYEIENGRFGFDPISGEIKE